MEEENASNTLDGMKNLQPVYTDTKHIDNEDKDYLKSLINESELKSMTVYPVLYADDNPEVIDHFCNSVDYAAIKVPVPEDIDGESYMNIFRFLAQKQKETRAEIDVILDLEPINNKSQANLLHAELKTALKAYDQNNKISGNIIIAMTSFPDDLSSIPAGESVFVDRYEMNIFEKILDNPDFSHLRERFIFSDYGVTRFTDSEIDFRRLRHGILPKARYTTPDKYWILKGKKDRITKEMIINHKTIAAEIVESQYYYGENFSFGDLDIKKRAMGEKGPGNNTNWVTIAANHHIAAVIEQLSKVRVF